MITITVVFSWLGPAELESATGSARLRLQAHPLIPKDFRARVVAQKWPQLPGSGPDMAGAGSGSASLLGNKKTGGGPAYTGNALADFLLGYPSQAQVGNGEGSENAHTYWAHFYVQDGWRVTPSLKLDVGLRLNSIRI
jgi:hypothetical protein